MLISNDTFQLYFNFLCYFLLSNVRNGSVRRLCHLENSRFKEGHQHQLLLARREVQALTGQVKQAMTSISTVYLQNMYTRTAVENTATHNKWPALLNNTSRDMVKTSLRGLWTVLSILYTPCSPPHPSPFHRSPNVCVPHCFVLPSPAPLVSCPPCCALCVSSQTSLDNVCKN